MAVQYHRHDPSQQVPARDPSGRRPAHRGLERPSLNASIARPLAQGSARQRGTHAVEPPLAGDLGRCITNASSASPTPLLRYHSTAAALPGRAKGRPLGPATTSSLLAATGLSGSSAGFWDYLLDP